MTEYFFRGGEFPGGLKDLLNRLQNEFGVEVWRVYVVEEWGGKKEEHFIVFDPAGWSCPAVGSIYLRRRDGLNEEVLGHEFFHLLISDEQRGRLQALLRRRSYVPFIYRIEEILVNQAVWDFFGLDSGLARSEGVGTHRRFRTKQGLVQRAIEITPLVPKVLRLSPHTGEMMRALIEEIERNNLGVVKRHESFVG